MVASILPPASFYDAERTKTPNDAFVFSELDFASTYATQKFNEGDAGVLGFKPQVGMSVLFDVKIYMPEKDEFEDYGFAVAPLLQALDTDGDSDNMEHYVNSGIFSLPIYKGKITAQQVSKIKAAGRQATTVTAAMLAAKEIEYLPNASVIAKIVDSQRKLHFRESFEKKTPSTRFVDPKLVS